MQTVICGRWIYIVNKFAHATDSLFFYINVRISATLPIHQSGCSFRSFGKSAARTGYSKATLTFMFCFFEFLWHAAYERLAFVRASMKLVTRL